MEKPGLNSAVWPNLSLPMSAVDNREANPKKAAPSNHRIPLRGHKYKKEKFITLGDDPANQSVGIEEINSSVVSFREAAAAQDIVAETSICLNILSAMERMGVESEDLTALREDLTLARNRYLAGDDNALLVLRFRLGDPAAGKKEGEDKHMPSGKVRRAAQPPGTASFLDLIYRTKYVPAGNSLGAVLYGLSRAKLREKLSDESISSLDLEQMPASFKGAETRWTSKRSIKNAKKREDAKIAKEAKKTTATAKKEAKEAAKAARGEKEKAMQMTPEELAAALYRLRL